MNRYIFETQRFLRFTRLTAPTRESELSRQYLALGVESSINNKPDCFKT